MKIYGNSVICGVTNVKCPSKRYNIVICSARNSLSKTGISSNLRESRREPGRVSFINMSHKCSRLIHELVNTIIFRLKLIELVNKSIILRKEGLIISTILIGIIFIACFELIHLCSKSIDLS